MKVERLDEDDAVEVLQQVLPPVMQLADTLVAAGAEEQLAARIVVTALAFWCSQHGVSRAVLIATLQQAPLEKGVEG